MDKLTFGCISWVLACAIVVGCGSDPKRPSSSSGSDGGSGGIGGFAGPGGAGGAGGTAGAGGDMGTIPDPGIVMGGEWTDVEPNDLPSQAVPVGIVAGSIWAGFVEPFTAINSPTDVDYFVFKTDTAASLANVNIQLCWSFMGNLLDLNLYNVTSGKKGSLVASATTTAAGCETVVAIGEGPAKLKAQTTYLLEVVAGPGLNLAGDPGLYSA